MKQPFLSTQCLSNNYEQCVTAFYLFPLLFSVWDIDEGTRLVAQYNSQARITAAEFLNPHDISFLLTGSGAL